MASVSERAFCAAGMFSEREERAVRTGAQDAASERVVVCGSRRPVLLQVDDKRAGVSGLRLDVTQTLLLCGLGREHKRKTSLLFQRDLPSLAMGC